ncbi:uncharacterized protein LOC123659291 [Melitaea cinxia]|uniref:uncharacterized protein LOC123659291 n=1 Tax=Melitaea cinxia TaxID=113334 RepID=UPI001E26F77E|nr:uncharacterized protein LOC123659291 [Melitaea cinxia]
MVINSDLNNDKNSQIEVRAVMIKCKNENLDDLEEETTRFQREELFKHNALRNCKQKLTITLKSQSFPNIRRHFEEFQCLPNPCMRDAVEGVHDVQRHRDHNLSPVFRLIRHRPQAFEGVDCSIVLPQQISGDEYIPIDHVIDGNKKRIRLLNPYVLRLRRKLPFQAYKLRKMNLGEDRFRFRSSTTKENKIIDLRRGYGSKETNNKQNYNRGVSHESMLSFDNETNKELELVVYEICDPDLWYTAHVQLFEKLTTPEGNTLWNDLMKHATPSVSSLRPEWSDDNLNIQYKPMEWLAREDCALPLQSLCLITPSKFDSSNFREGNRDNVLHRKVAVRMTRALVGNTVNNFKIISRGPNRFLKLPHTKPLQTQIDIEVKADDNSLVLVGKNGRLTTVVTDSSRQTRSVFSIQATNMGLASARFRVLIRECTPKLSNVILKKRESEYITAGYVLFPPRLTQSFRLDLPVTIPVENAHCVVALLNENEEAVAVRDVRIKRDDRCFCVWYCDCVCLSEDPKLLCRRLSEPQLIAAGLPIQEKSRHIRSVCYPDVVTLNLFVTIIGVILALLLLGLLKAILGLVLSCVGSWGLQLMMQTPRKLDHYYESSLRSRQVVYDREGWPIHPDTKQRNVRLISKQMEFMLNLIFFVTLPCILICDALKKMVLYCNATEKKQDGRYRKNEEKKCFSSRDAQSITPRNRQRHGGLHKWMSPQAEELSTGIWNKGLIPQDKSFSDFFQPLLYKEKCCNEVTNQSLCMDSEQDDTEYIIMQIQKSKESIARSQRIMEINPNAKNAASKE